MSELTRKFGFQTINEDRFQTFDWIDITPNPKCPECEFCVVPGQDNKSAPMLERTASSLISSTEAFVHEESSLFPKVFDKRFYFNVIVTTAKLNVCTFDPASISLRDGTLSEAEFIEVPFLRFRKQLQTAPMEKEFSEQNFSYSVFSKIKENTVFVVNSLHFQNFLKAFDVGVLRGIL